MRDAEFEKRDWEAERRNGSVMKIYRKATVRQYFHKGLLWRASGQTEVASFELFVDLLYVGILAINGDHVAEDPTGYELLRFSITFIMTWKIWSDLTLVVSWFETNDIVQRLSIMFVMACLLGLTTNMLDALHETYSQLVAFYLTARLFIGSYFIFLIFVLPLIRGMMVAHAILTLIPSALWIGNIHIDMPQRLAAIWVAIIMDLCGSVSVIVLLRGAEKISRRFGQFIDRHFEFYPAINIEHKVERKNAFVTLVFGYSVVAIIYQNAASFGINAFYGKAVLGLVQAFCFNWIYFELDGVDLFTHAIRRAAFSSILWTSMHLPFIMGYVLGAAALSKLDVTADCADADIDTLTEAYMARSEHEIPIGLRWFYCAGLSVALSSMAVISACHIHKEPPSGRNRLQKRYRIANRLGICIILLCLPAADSLNSLQLISITTTLIAWVLLLELWGTGCPKEALIGEERPCKYTARCNVSKKELQSAVKSGKVVDVRSLSDRGEKGYEFG